MNDDDDDDDDNTFTMEFLIKNGFKSLSTGSVHSHQQTTVTNNNYHGFERQTSDITNEQRSQKLSSQHHSSSQPKARKTLDSQFTQKKQV